jgi:Lon protease-like protein
MVCCSMAPPDSVALFPLANVVLFPTQSVPLYIFEPRYRQMIRDVLSGDRQIGMVAVQPGHLDEMQGDPPVFDVGCLGSVEHAKRRPDGTYTFVLRATDRFRIVEELGRPPEQLYRTARIERFADPLPDADRERVAAARSEVSAGLGRLLERLEEQSAAKLSLDRLDDVRFINALAQALDFDVLERQRLLETTNVLERYDLMGDLMRFRLAEIGARGGPGSGVLH